MKTLGRCLSRITLVCLGLSATAARGQAPRIISAPPRLEMMEAGEGVRIIGKISGDAASGYRFVPDGGVPAIPLDEGGTVGIEGPGPDPSSGSPPFQVLLGPWGRLSGRLTSIDPSTIRLESTLGASRIAIERMGCSSVIQRPGEVQVFRDGFETLDIERWSQGGTPEAVEMPRLTGSHGLKLPAGGSSLTARLAEPLGSGRMEIAFFDDGARAAGQRWFVDLTFRKANSDITTLRAIPGWIDETLAVESPGGSAMNIQPLGRRPGWHRLTIRFDEQRAELAVDGDALAHGKGPGGPLFEIRLATESTGTARPPEGLAAVLDDLRLVRFVEPFGKVEVDPSQDEVRKISGDQLFGSIAGADADRVVLNIEGREVRPPWSEVSGLYFRRSPASSAMLEGVWVRAEWRTAAGSDARDVDRAEGVLEALSDAEATLRVPYVGRLTIARDRLRRLQFLRRARRMVIDPTTHHIGDSWKPDLDPPQPEKAPLEVAFHLAEIPPGDAFLSVDVVQLVGFEGTPRFSDQVKNGQLRTRSSLNGRPLEDWNKLVSPRNETPERLRLAIPPGTLKVGQNVVRIEQTENDLGSRDNFGLLEMALEFTTARPPGAARP